MPSLAQLERLLAADPNDAFTLYAMAQELCKQGSHQKSVEFYDRCIAVDAGYCYAYYHKAKALEAMGQIDAVRTTLQQGIAAAKVAQDRKALSELSSYLAAL